MKNDKTQKTLRPGFLSSDINAMDEDACEAERKRIVSMTKQPQTTRRTRDGSLENDHWGTPKALYDKLDAEFHFDFDPCPLRSTFDGLVIPWGKSNFVNPPYNRVDKPKFIQKAYEEWRKGNTCVLLIPAAVSTKQFHDIILPHAKVRFLRGRVGFVGDYGEGKKKGKHDSMIVIFRGKP